MGQPFRLLVTGSRTWHDIAAIEQTLAVILDRHPEGVLLVHGACPRGADAIAAAYAARTPGYQVEAHPADWRRYGRAAGYRRSAEMIALGADGAPHSSAAAAQAAPAQSGWPQSQAYRSGSTHSDQARAPSRQPLYATADDVPDRLINGGYSRSLADSRCMASPANRQADPLRKPTF